jgi:opacity protein-like surface antigen
MRIAIRVGLLPLLLCRIQREETQRICVVIFIFPHLKFCHPLSASHLLARGLIMSRKLILLLCLCALPVLAFSQAAVSANTPIGAHLPSGLNGEVYGGLQWESFDLHNFLGLPGTSSVPRQSLVGFHASTSVALSRWLATEGEISRSSNTYKALFVAGDHLATSSLTFMAGPRVTYHLGPLAQFAHVLIGVDRLNATYTPPAGSSGKASSNPFTFAIGGGTSFHVSQRFGLATTVDYIRPSTSGMSLTISVLP